MYQLRFVGCIITRIKVTPLSVLSNLILCRSRCAEIGNDDRDKCGIEMMSEIVGLKWWARLWARNSECHCSPFGRYLQRMLGSFTTINFMANIEFAPVSPSAGCPPPCHHALPNASPYRRSCRPTASDRWLSSLMQPRHASSIIDSSSIAAQARNIQALAPPYTAMGCIKDRGWTEPDGRKLPDRKGNHCLALFNEFLFIYSKIAG